MKKEMMMMKGSLSIEASIVMPFVLISILCLIYLVFFFHDQTVLKGLAHQYLQTYTMMEDSTGVRYIYDNPVTIRREIENYGGGFLLGNSSELTVEISELDCVIYKEAIISVSIPMRFLFYDGVIMVEEKKIVTSGTEIIRLVECINDFF